MFYDFVIFSFSLVLPLSLQAFIASCHCLALPRKQLVKEALGSNDKIPSGGHVEHNFRKHVKLKKQYEVKFLSQVILKLSNPVISDDDISCRPFIFCLLF